MYKIHEAMSDRGFTGFFIPWPKGCFTVTPQFAWVTSDLVNWTETIREGEVAASALIQGF